MTGPGTHHLAYFSDERRLFPDMMWVLSKPTAHESKLLTAWFDSTFGWLQSLSNRIETRGGWIEWHKYIVEELRAPDIPNIDKNHRGDVVEVYEDAGLADAPSIFQQLARLTNEDQFSQKQKDDIDAAFDDLTAELGTGFDTRAKLDSAWLEIAGVDESKREQILANLYSGMLIEIVNLKLMMDS